MQKFICRLGERLLPHDYDDLNTYILYLRHKFAYEFVKNIIPENSVILDIGCGEGYGTSSLAERAYRVIGLDVDKKTITRASKKYILNNCCFKLYNGKKIPFDEKIFDVVVSLQVIEHIEDYMSFLCEVYRTLKINGMFILTTPNKISRLKSKQQPWNPFHKKEYECTELEIILKSFFRDVKVYGISATEKIKKFESKRIKNITNIIKFDVINLRNILPKELLFATCNLVNKVFCTTRYNKKFSSMYNVNDYFITNDVQNCLDLLGICRK